MFVKRYTIFMTWKQTIAEHGHANDMALISIMNFFETCERKVNKNELTLMGFKRFRKAQRDYVKFSTETIGRKARLLAEIGILKVSRNESGHTFYSYEGTGNPVEKQKYFIRNREGNRIQVV